MTASDEAFDILAIVPKGAKKRGKARAPEKAAAKPKKIAKRPPPAKKKAIKSISSLDSFKEVSTMWSQAPNAPAQSALINFTFSTNADVPDATARPEGLINLPLPTASNVPDVSVQAEGQTYLAPPAGSNARDTSAGSESSIDLTAPTISNSPDASTRPEVQPNLTLPIAQGTAIGDDFELSFNSANEARSIAHPRALLNIKNDDLDEVKKHDKSWVRKMMQAIVYTVYADPSTQRRSGIRLDAQEVVEYRR